MVISAKQVLIGLITIGTLDIFWMGFFAKKLYRRHLSHVMLKPENMLTQQWFAAALAWLAIVFGILIFVVPQTLNASFADTACSGGLFGSLMYGIYELTNYALLKHWPITIVITDILWGTFLCSLLTVVLALMV